MIFEMPPNGLGDLMLAAEKGSLSTIKKGLNKDGLNVNDAPLLHTAIRYNQMKVAYYLLQREDINIHAPDRNGKTPAELAVNHRCPEILQMLIDKGADTSMIPDPQHEDEWFRDVNKIRDILSTVRSNRHREFWADIENRNIEGLRAKFDQAFWNQTKIPVRWVHLKTALLRGDQAIVQLLVTHGATATLKDVQSLPDHDRHYDYARMLRRAGLRIALPPKPQGPRKQKLAATEFVEACRVDGDAEFPGLIDERVTKLPREWRRVLKATQKSLGQEAVIAGGALRDTENGKPVGDIDIFVKQTGRKYYSNADRRKRIRKVFEAAGLQVREQYPAGSLSMGEFFPDPSIAKHGEILKDAGFESWTIATGGGYDRTMYNIIFVDGALTSLPRAQFAQKLIETFDIGICQIATDGVDIFTTERYRRDTAEQRIAIAGTNRATAEHVSRIRRKYRDWDLCPEAKELMLEPGLHAEDGSIYLGLHDNRHWFVAELDAWGNFNYAASKAATGGWHGHNDWELPNHAIMTLVHKHKEKQSLRMQFNFVNNARSYWSTTPPHGDNIGLRTVWRFKDNVTAAFAEKEACFALFVRSTPRGGL